MGKKPELLSPAGDWEKLHMAVAYGADAVYLAGAAFGMRSFARFTASSCSLSYPQFSFSIISPSYIYEQLFVF